MLLAMFDRLIATVLSVPDASTAASRLAIASKQLAAGRNGSAGILARASAIRWGNSAWVLMPVPTAVPPIGKLGERLGCACRSRRTAVLDLRGVARELLPEPDRHGVLQVGPADLDDRRRSACGLLARVLRAGPPGPGPAASDRLRAPRRGWRSG